MATTTTLSEQEYRELALSEPDRNWELWNGMPRAKPPMSMKHNAVSFLLGHFLQNQLERSVYRVNVNSDRARISSRAYYIPDVIVIPAAYQRVFEHDSRALGVYAKPLPFVAEVWSPSTGDYDITAKLPLYQGRGDLEIWFIHPSERTLTVWRKQPDGTYAEGHYTSGIVPVASLPNVTIDFDALLDG
ncbi:MAG: Uma2 family endonuclease [Chloroflexia bacterium]|nr:Uma2 family endonuclease [Chloroflexia bacterium]